jgi:uncharacterized protein
LLRNTFCHIPGIGPRSERRLWANGFLLWDDVVRVAAEALPVKNQPFLNRFVTESIDNLEHGDSQFFARYMPSAEQWRLFADFRHSVAYLDIETTGMAGQGNHITTISMYDGHRVFYYVNGRNLRQFREDISEYKLLVTYNGRCFDVPFIESYLRIKMNHAHIDLRFLLKSLGYTGGLKGCEKKLGLDREELDGLDGFAAVLLWEEYRRNNDEKALETLLAYNVLDAVNLEVLMVKAYNLKLQETPFVRTHELPEPSRAENPFVPHMPVVARIKDIMSGFRE